MWSDAGENDPEAYIDQQGFRGTSSSLSQQTQKNTL